MAPVPLKIKVNPVKVKNASEARQVDRAVHKHIRYIRIVSERRVGDRKSVCVLLKETLISHTHITASNKFLTFYPPNTILCMAKLMMMYGIKCALWARFHNL